MTTLATVAGIPLTEAPTDLFIPPDALEVFLDLFSGPLDLLLYLIRRQNIDILDIPILQITQQYMQYIELMEERHMELAADYLVMAAVLAEIKSRMLLPISPSEDNEMETDPRLELVRRLQIYEQFKQAATTLDALPRLERDFFQVHLPIQPIEIKQAPPEVTLERLVEAMCKVIEQKTLITHHQIHRESLSVRERMGLILGRLQNEKLIEFSTLLQPDEGRQGVVVSLLALLELAKQTLLIITQTTIFAPIYIKACDE